MRISVFRRAHFNAAHRLFVKDWSDEENKNFFGKCSNPMFHGHNYEIEVRLTGEMDPKTGFLYDLGKLKGIIEEEIIERYDHKNLNLECEEFKEVNPTAENICIAIYTRLRNRIKTELELRVRLWETARNYVEYPV